MNVYQLPFCLCNYRSGLVLVLGVDRVLIGGPIVTIRGTTIRVADPVVRKLTKYTTAVVHSINLF
jgi:hypothetical protein